MNKDECIAICPQLNRRRTTVPRGVRHRRAACAGATLVEVVVASALLAILSASLLSVFSFSRRSAKLASDRLVSLNRARAALEYLRSQPDGAGLLAVGDRKRPLPNLAEDDGYYRVTEANGGNVKDITVVVEWTEPWGAAQSISLTTSLCRGLHP